MEGSLQQVPLSEIDDTIGTPPSQRLQESVERMGVLQPVMLSRHADDAGEISLNVIDGNRRIGAARAVGLPNVPAIVFENLEPNAVAETTLASNHFRSANYLAEFWALKHLERNQYPNDDIIAASGMARSSIELRYLLSNLNRDLFVALRNGQLNQSNATAIAKLPRHQQDELAKKFRQSGQLNRRDIQAYAPSSSAGTQSGDKIADQLSDVASAANKLGYSKDEFLELAARKWDEVNG